MTTTNPRHAQRRFFLPQRLLSRCGTLALALGLLAWQAPSALAQTPPAISPPPAAANCPPAAMVPTTEQMQAGMKNARDRGFLWRATKNGRSSYLYGTVHVAKRDWIYPGATVIRAAGASDTVALELDMLDPDIALRLAAGMTGSSAPALPPALAARLRAQAERACLPMEMLSPMPPELQVTTLAVMAGRADGFDPSYAIDVFLAGLARGLKKSVVSLETPESQLKVLLSEDPKETVAMVQKELDELESGRARAMLRRIADTWAEGRLDDLQHYEQWCGCADTAEDRHALRRLLDDRNPGMAARVAELHESGHSVFAAVGSLHMIGPAGLPALLAKRGYQVERIEFPR